MAKVTIIGAGNVGSHTAVYSAWTDLTDLVLLDIDGDKARGVGLDITQAMAMINVDRVVTGTGDYADTAGSDVVVVTAGVARKPGMSRDDLLAINAKVVSSVVREAVKHSPDCILLIVTNPINTMTQLAYEVSGLPKERVIGVAGVLDSARFRSFIAEELDVPASTVRTMVLGDHGADMVPLVGNCKVDGQPISELLSAERIDAIVDRVRHGGSEIVELLKTGSAYFAPGTAVVELLQAILNDSREALPSAVLLQGEYGIEDLYVGVPARIGREGVVAIEEVRLTPAEREALQLSAEHIRARNRLCL